MRSAVPFELIMKAWPYSRSQSAGRFGLVSMAAISQRMAFCLPSAKTRQAMFLEGDWNPVGFCAWAAGANAINENTAAKNVRRFISVLAGFGGCHART